MTLPQVTFSPRAYFSKFSPGAMIATLPAATSSGVVMPVMPP